MTNDASFGALYQAEYTPVLRLTYVMLGDRAAAEDVTQEAFARAYARWRTVGRYERPDAWVRRVAIRQASRARHRRGSEEQLQEAAAEVDGGDLDLMRALASLSPAQRAAIALHYLEGLPVAQVADALGCAEATAKVHLHRARRRLAELLEEVDPDVVR